MLKLLRSKTTGGGSNQSISKKSGHDQATPFDSSSKSK